MGTALRAYRQGRYASAYASAAPLTRSATELRRYEAAYVAGIAAMRGGRDADAEVMLQLARRAPRDGTRARALAASGILAAKRGQHREAAEWLEMAAGALEPLDARQALEQAAVSRRRLGDRTAAEALVRRARDVRVQVSRPSGVSARNAVLGRPAAGPANVGETGAEPAAGFTIQVGAFRDGERAREAALRAGGRVAGAGIGGVEVDGPGRSRSGLYTVHVGRFETRSAAERMRRQLGLTQWVVTESSGV
ncbi:MAG: SPOR domain-containing protein [Phycisphaerales bacterium]